MRKFSRFFISFVFIGLLTAYAPITQAEMQPGPGNMSHTPASRAHEAQSRSYGRKVGDKALNAFANLTTGVLEIPKNIINTTNRSNVIYGVIGGLFKGMIHTAGRIGVGITDLVTIPLPTRPIAQPAYIWDNFNVDTSYGPVFRLDRSLEIEPVVQTPSVAPVLAAPAVVAPKAPPIVDRSGQYSQDTNKKLDTLFKKQMMK